MSATTEKGTWDASRILSSNPLTVSLITPFNVPKSVNILVSSNQKVLLGAIDIDNLRSKSAPTNLSGNFIVHKLGEIGQLVLIAKQNIEFKANIPELQRKSFQLSIPIIIQPDCKYKMRFVFDTSWAPRNFYCLTKIVKNDMNIDGETTVTTSPEIFNGDTSENELPMVFYFNRL